MRIHNSDDKLITDITDLVDGLITLFPVSIDLEIQQQCNEKGTAEQCSYHTRNRVSQVHLDNIFLFRADMKLEILL